MIHQNRIVVKNWNVRRPRHSTSRWRAPASVSITVGRGPVPREFPGDRSMARDRPSPCGKERRFFTAARVPVPRERWDTRTIRASSVVCDRLITNGSGVTPDLQGWRRRAAPRVLERVNNGEGQALALREREPFFFTAARVPVPRELPGDRSMGEGLSLALREGEPFFHRSARACPPRAFRIP